jgi:hypothetical protein
MKWRLNLLWWIAAVLPAQTLPPGTLLLARTKAHLREEIAHLPDCSCLETIHRDYRPAGGRMRPLDTIRLEVLAAGNRELFASPGDRKFREGHPIEYAGSGVIGNGYFSLFLRDIATERGPSYEYRGVEPVDGRRLERYDYRLPQMISGHTISVNGVGGTVGMKGSFWVDAATFDLLRLEMHADEIPPNLPIAEADTSVTYARMKLGEREVLLPVNGEYRQLKFDGEESVNRIEFTHCRLFGAQSSIHFGAPGEAAPQAVREPQAELERALPAGLAVTIRLTAAVTDAMAVGEMVEGVVAGKVSYRGGVLIEDGAKVRGRVRRMDRPRDGEDYFVLGLEFTEIEGVGLRYRLWADLQDLDRATGVEMRLRNGGETIWLPDLPGVGCFFVRGRRVDLPKGFRMTWRTRAEGK